MYLYLCVTKKRTEKGKNARWRLWPGICVIIPEINYRPYFALSDKYNALSSKFCTSQIIGR